MQNSKTLKALVQFSFAAGAIYFAPGAASTAMAGAAMPREAGVWIDDTGKGAIRLEVCGAKLCGRIVWLRETLNAKGEPLTDKRNPDASKNTRPICGLPVIGELLPMPEGGFDGGWIYDPKTGQSYSVALQLAGPGKLKVTGYKGVKFLGKSFIWTRAEEELPSCDVTPAEAAAPIKPPAPTPAKRPQKPGQATAGEELPWATGKAAPAAKPPAGASNLGASGMKAQAGSAAAKKNSQPPAKKTTPQRPAASASP